MGECNTFQVCSNKILSALCAIGIAQRYLFSQFQGFFMHILFKVVAMFWKASTSWLSIHFVPVYVGYTSSSHPRSSVHVYRVPMSTLQHNNSIELTTLHWQIRASLRSSTLTSFPGRGAGEKWHAILTACASMAIPRKTWESVYMYIYRFSVKPTCVHSAYFHIIKRWTSCMVFCQLKSQTQRGGTYSPCMWRQRWFLGTHQLVLVSHYTRCCHLRAWPPTKPFGCRAALPI